MQAWSRPFGGRFAPASGMLPDALLPPLRHFWWNGGYFGCIFQARSMLPKADVSLSLTRRRGVDLTGVI